MGRELNGKALQALISEIKQARLVADGPTHSLCFIDVEHFEIHAGTSFRVAAFADIAAGATWDWQLITPNTPIRIHMFFDVEVEAETEIEIRERATFAAVASVATPNRDRNSATTAKLLVDPGATVATPGTLLWSFKLGSGKKSGGGSRPANEIILARNTIYLFRMKNTSVSTGWISPELNWYEITPKD